MKTSSTKRLFEMKREYDFSHGIRGRFYKSRKVQKTIRLDDDTLIHLQKLAALRRIGYQTLINEILRQAVNRELQVNRNTSAPPETE
jgi:uncharacterized protein (DUF4415 family)